MPFLRPLNYFTDRFYEKQEDAWLAYKAGLDLILDYGRRCINPVSKVLSQDGVKSFGDIVGTDRILSFDQKANQFRFSESGSSFPKTKEIGYRVIHDLGEFVVSGQHRVFCSDYKYRSVLEIKELIEKDDASHGVAFLCPDRSIEELAQIMFPLNAHRLKKTHANYQDHCGTYSRQYDQQPLLGLNSGQALSRQISYAQEYDLYDGQKQLSARLGGHYYSLLKHSHHGQSHGQNANLGEVVPSYGRHGSLSLLPFDEQTYERFRDQCQGAYQQGLSSSALHKGTEFDQVDVGQYVKSCTSSIVAIEQVSITWFWDVTIPGDHNYISEGAIHHNSGKSELIAELFIEDIEDHGRDCLYIALTQDQARDIMWGKFESRLQGNSQWRSNASRLEWRHIPSQAKISLKGSDIGKHRLRGGAKRLIALDEFAFFKDPSMVKDVLIPMIADYNGQMIYTSTPKGKNHFYQLKERALVNTQRYFTNHATVFDNPYVSEEGRNKLLEEYTGEDDPLYRQEVLGEYIDYQGLVFALPVDTYTEDRWWHADLEHSFVWRGLDHGYSPDPTACVWIAYNKKKGYFQCFSEYEKAELLIVNHAAAINSLEPFKVIDTYADHDTQCNAEYEAVGLNVTNAQKHDKESKLLYLVNQLRIGRLKISKNCTKLLSQMSTFEWDQDGNDHLIDALRYAITSITLPQVETFKDVPQYKTRSYDGYSQDFGD